MLAQFYPPIVGGEEQHVRNLSRKLHERGHDVSIATIWHPGQTAFELDDGLRVHRLHGTLERLEWLYSEAERHHAPSFPDPQLVSGLRKVVEQEKPQIVHAHNWMVYSYLPVHRKSQASLLVTLHDYSLICAKKRLMYHGELCSGPGPLKCLECASRHYGLLKGIPTTLTNWMMAAWERRTVSMFLPVSQAVAEGNGLPGSDLPFQVLPNFVADDITLTGDPSDPLLDQLPDGDFILFVGDLIREKGLAVLLEAYSGLESAPPLVLIGRRSQDTPQGFPPGVSYLGSWPHPVVMEAWRRSLLGVVPSIWGEPFGTVLLEAMASGKPLITTRIGGIPDVVVDGETGLLVPPGDAAALRQALVRLVEDGEMRVRFGEAGRRRVVRFQASAVVTNLESIYQEVSGLPRGSGFPVDPERSYE
jgi:glycosyltransferase involved in cell wall biosynthesis